MDLQLKGKVAVVSGGSRGIGRRIVQAFADEGCDVSFCGRDEENLCKAEEDLRAAGVNVHAFCGDITDPSDSDAFINGAAEALGGIDILVNNVGGASGGAKPFAETTDEDWLKTYEMNVFHSVRATRLVLPHFQKRGGGAVAIISSISGWLGGGYPQYGSTKAGEIFLARELAIDLADQNVRVNAICPGSILWEDNGWDNFRKGSPEVFADFEKREFPFGRLGTPEEIADVVAFICSPRASWVTGALIPVDGAQRRPAVDRKER